MKLLLSAFCILFLCGSFEVYCYKILAICSAIQHSHYTQSFRIIKELADRGHEVTFVSTKPQKTPIKNLKEIQVTGLEEIVEGYVVKLDEFGQISTFAQLEWLNEYGSIQTQTFLKHENVQKLLKSNEKFDLVYVHHFFNDALMAFAHKFNAPLVVLVPWDINSFDNYLVGNPTPVSYVTHVTAEYSPNMTFWQRLDNAYRQTLVELYIYLRMIPEQNRVLQEYFPNAPDLKTILFNASLVLSASHVSLSQAIPLQQNVKTIGGFHVKPPNPLPKDLQEFMDKSTEGVVIFTMGSLLKSSTFDDKKLKAIFNAFSKIKQKVLWKFDDIPNKPSNVKILKWLPQSDLLAHPNTVAFISHGGLLGTTEAVYHGVPILGLPVFWDQSKNVGNAADKGFALRVPFAELDEESFTTALLEILNNPKYKKRAKEISAALRDQPMKQLDEAVFWIEYVVRHNGAPHLRSAVMNLKWYQIYNLDIILFVVVVFIVLLRLIVLVISKLFGKKKVVSKSKKNK